MHWTDTRAVRAKGVFGYAGGPVLASVAIALVAATVARWFTVAVDRPGLRVLAGAW